MQKVLLLIADPVFSSPHSSQVKREFLAGIRRKIGEDDPQELLEMLEGMTEKGRIAEEDVKMEVI